MSSNIESKKQDMDKNFTSDLKDLGKICFFLGAIAGAIALIAWVSNRWSLDRMSTAFLGLAYLLVMHLIYGRIGGLAKPRKSKEDVEQTKLPYSEFHGGPPQG